MGHVYEGSYIDVETYPNSFMVLHDDCVQVEATYKKTWDDGFGARGWKLNATISDPEIIASTRETGKRINTSVFIHDILDHFLSGFGVSGHRSESMALTQLSIRTGADPRPDYRQMVTEDILKGRVNGESLRTLLPYTLRSLLPEGTEISNNEIVVFLSKRLDERDLIDLLIDNFLSMGREGIQHADKSWKKVGLNPRKRTAIGVSLQRILNKVDYLAEKFAIEEFMASIYISNNNCLFRLVNWPYSDNEYSVDVI